MTRVAVGKARSELSETVNRVAYTGERIVLHRRGKDVAALVPVDDLALLEKLEDCLDLEAARKALQQPGRIPWKKIKAKLGL